MKAEGITAVPGVLASGLCCGIKKSKPDLALLYSEKPCTAVAVYTKNTVKGAPLLVTKEHLRNGVIRAVIVNSGIANVCTSQRGISDARMMCQETAKYLGIPAESVLVASTGVIGHYLPMDKITKAIPRLCKSRAIKNNAAEAILTTDLKPKHTFIRKNSFTIGAIAKGSGMIHPNMATMLSFIFTDASIEKEKLQRMLSEATENSFNMISVDHDMSTSDMCLLLANGKAGKVDETEFMEALQTLCIDLAKMIAFDGEGATKLLEVEVANCKSKDRARMLAKSVVTSNLVKCACHGSDPNWGRILAALGGTMEDIDANRLQLSIGGILIFSKGVSAEFPVQEVVAEMKKQTVNILIDLAEGGEKATAYGCDMSKEYVTINTKYHT